MAPAREGLHEEAEAAEHDRARGRSVTRGWLYTGHFRFSGLHHAFLSSLFALVVVLVVVAGFVPCMLVLRISSIPLASQHKQV